MHAKRCAILTERDAVGSARIRRCVTSDLRRYLVLEDATVFFGHGSRNITANVVVTGIDIDAMMPELEAVEVIFVNLEISEDGDYRATLGELPGLPAHHPHRQQA